MNDTPKCPRITVMDEVKLLPCDTNKGLRLSQLRIDLDRDTGISVCRNVNGHIYVTLGKGRDATLIIHPHAAVRLCEHINRVLAGKDHASG